jgi:predicted oxidoreductase
LADQALLTLASEEAGATIDWLLDLGVPFSEDSPRLAPEHELYETPRSHYQTGPRTEWGGYFNLINRLGDTLRKLEAEGKVQIRLNEPMDSLVLEGGRVVGVKTGRGEYRAPAVVLTTGGYAGSVEELRRRHPDMPNLITASLTHADGSGMRAAEAAGAGGSFFQYMIPSPGWVEDPANPGHVLTWTTAHNGRPPAEAGDLWVNSAGKRFVAEDTTPDGRERALMAQGDNTMYMVFDQAMREKEPHGTWTSEKVEAHGALVKADTLADLGAALGFPPGNLEETVRRYNEAVDEGNDHEFGRQSMPGKLEKAPFYGVRTRGAMMGTRGGIDINDHLEVLDRHGNVMAGLYAGGEVVGTARMTGDGVCSGFNAGPAATFGRLAGQWAAEAALAARAVR